MTDRNLLQAMGRIDPVLIAEASPDVPYKKKTTQAWVKWGAVAACFILIASTIMLLLPLGSDGPEFFYPSSSQHGDASPGLYQTTFHFNSYNEMIHAFQKRDLNPGNYTIRELKKLLDEPYTRFVNQVTKDRSFPHPMLNGEPITYRNAEGFYNIAFSVNELYDLPWIWYYPYVSTGENFYIKMTYLPNDVVQDPETTPASEVIKALSPNSPNVNNKGKQHKDIYNKEITLADRNVTALVYEYKEDTRNTTFFVYGDLLVQISSDSDVWTDEWFASLSFQNIR
jgi:hypothetical protein